jgi:alpha-ribazole phosphatase
MEIYLIRHTAPHPGFSSGICYGQSDIPLAESFLSDTATLLAQLPIDADAVYSSPLSRCVSLAQVILSRSTPIFDERLKEMNFGEWEMKRWDNISPNLINDWSGNLAHFKIPGGESLADLDARVGKFMEELTAQPHEKVVIITHAGVVRVIVGRILEMPLKNLFRLSCDFGSVTKLQHKAHEGVAKLECFNSTSSALIRTKRLLSGTMPSFLATRSIAF